ncbi:hypothetical protein ABFA25_12550 [Mycobacterium lepromatosis]|uniref:hypothetical protein n=3 Tax=Mycobacterium lepromatosis TaxID=480418 RepID=UPI001872A3B3
MSNFFRSSLPREATSMAMPNADLILFALLGTLPIPVHWNSDVFIETRACQRGRPIQLILTYTSELTENPCELWLPSAADLIFYQARTSKYHIDQIMCHEIGHMALGHAGGRQADIKSTPNVEMFRKLLPDIDPTVGQSVLGSKVFVDDQEHGTEVCANMLVIAVVEAVNQTSMMRNVFFTTRLIQEIY